MKEDVWMGLPVSSGATEFSDDDSGHVGTFDYAND